MKPGPVKGFRPHRELTLRVRPFATSSGHFLREIKVIVHGVAQNRGTPFEYWEHKIDETMLDKHLGLGELEWHSNWDKDRWYASSRGRPIATVQVLDPEYSKEDVADVSSVA